MRVDASLLAGIPVEADEDGKVCFNLVHATTVFDHVARHQPVNHLRRGMSANSHAIGLYLGARQDGVSVDSFQRYVRNLQAR